jgi:hypothetical protein
VSPVVVISVTVVSAVVVASAIIVIGVSIVVGVTVGGECYAGCGTKESPGSKRLLFLAATGEKQQ